MLVSDEGCIAEQTILKFQNNSVAELMGGDWYGIMLFSPKGKIFIDSCYDISGVGADRVLAFASKHVTEDFLADGEPDTFNEGECCLYAYPIRRNSSNYYVFFVFYKESGSFQERDLRWYKVFAKTAIQRMLLENELAQDKNYLANILRSVDEPIAVINAEYEVVSANAMADRIYGKSLMTADFLGNPTDMRKAVDEVIFNGCDADVNLASKNESVGKARLTPLKNNKDIVVAVVAVGGGELLNE